ncbi:MAG: winged helix-turn-helix domain-containing protein [Nanobdellota archaeon]
MQYIAYYEKRKEVLLDFFPKDIDTVTKKKIQNLWNQPVAREIMKTLSVKEQATAPEIQKEVGHSMSTLHENITKLENNGLIKTEMVYTKNKRKIIVPEIMFVNRNSRLTEAITKFLNQGLMVDSRTGRKVIKFLDNNKDRAFTVEQISVKTGIQVDEVETLLENWNSLITRAFSEVFKEKPFVKRVTYQSIKGKNVGFNYK